MSHSLRVIFAGTPEFAAAALAAIHEAGFPVPLVLTQPDRPAGRGMKLQASPVKRYAQEQGIEVAQPPSLRRNGKFPAEASAAIDQLRATPHDVMVVAAYGLLLPQEVLDIAPHGCINIHASLLPRWRGAAPIHRAIAAGDAETGITLMQMDAGLDTGPIIAAREVAIGADDTAGTLSHKLAEAGARAIVETLGELAHRGMLASTPQPAEGVTYAAKIMRADRIVDWASDAAAIARKLRALSPAPGAFAQWNGASLKVWGAEPVVRTSAAAPGDVLRVNQEGIDVACGKTTAGGTLRLREVQPAGARRMTAHAFALGHRIAVGMRFDPAVG